MGQSGYGWCLSYETDLFVVGTYDEAGQISAELGEHGRIQRQYVYLADQPIAVIDTPDGKALSNNELSAQAEWGL